MSLFTNAAVTFALLACVACGTARTTGPAGPPNSPPGAVVARPTQPTSVNNDNPGTIPVGQEIDVRLQSSLGSDTASVEQRFETTTAVDLVQSRRVLVPAGSVVRGVVSGVDKASRLDRSGALTLSFDRMAVNGRQIPMRATATQVFESGGLRDENGTAALGTGVGGIVGGLLGGVKGVVLGAVIGAGGAIAATEGKDINLPAGTHRPHSPGLSSHNPMTRPSALDFERAG
jgi:hypothetical protein